MVEARNIIENAVAQVNATLPPDRAISAGETTILLGPGATCDSLSVTSIFFEIETAMAAAGHPVDMFSAPFLLTPDTDTSLGDIAAWLKTQAGADTAA